MRGKLKFELGFSYGLEELKYKLKKELELGTGSNQVFTRKIRNFGNKNFKN